MLFDPATAKITGVLDFDFSYVGHPADEYLAYSFGDMGGSLTKASPALRRAILSGDFAYPPVVVGEGESTETDSDEADAFALSREFFAALAEHGGFVPSAIPGMAALESLREGEALLAPFALSVDVMIERARKKGVDLDAARAAAEQKLVGWLEGVGY